MEVSEEIRRRIQRQSEEGWRTHLAVEMSITPSLKNEFQSATRDLLRALFREGKIFLAVLQSRLHSIPTSLSEAHRV